MPGKNTSVVLVLVLSLLAVLASPVFSARPLQSTVEEGLSKSEEAALEEFGELKNTLSSEYDWLPVRAYD